MRCPLSATLISVSEKPRLQTKGKIQAKLNFDTACLSEDLVQLPRHQLGQAMQTSKRVKDIC